MDNSLKARVRESEPGKQKDDNADKIGAEDVHCSKCWDGKIIGVKDDGRAIISGTKHYFGEKIGLKFTISYSEMEKLGQVVELLTRATLDGSGLPSQPVFR